MLTREDLSDFDSAVQKEWLVTNGLGGYASSTVLGINTRKYHGLLVAALHPPGDRTVCLAKLDEEIRVSGTTYQISANQFSDVFYPEGFRFLQSFSASPYPLYVYEAGRVTISKMLFMPHEKNVIAAIYRINNQNRIDAQILMTPLTTCRHFHQVVHKSDDTQRFHQDQTSQREVQLSFEASGAQLIIRATEGEFHAEPNWIERIFYREEALRGESSIDDCYQPGNFEIRVPPNAEKELAIVASANLSQQNNQAAKFMGASVAEFKSLLEQELQHRANLFLPIQSWGIATSSNDWLRWVLLAADSFIVKGPNNGKSVIAGYHWFEAWGRDTFVSLPGLMLVTGKFENAREVLVGFNKFCMNGLIPNFLSELSLLPSCNTVDATMWHVNSVLQYLKYTGDFDFVKNELWESLKDIIESHTKGTGFGIHMDHDGLLAHGAQLTWMDSDVDGKAVTPRAGKAVEIQALWYNAVKIMQLLAAKFDERNLVETYSALADKARTSFNRKFWNANKSCLFDVLSEFEVDASLRPNQVVAISLDFTMLSNQRSELVVDLLENNLWTPCGLRTLSRSDSRYRGKYVGDRKSRNQAYHNGAVWPWLTGPFTTAFLKTKGYSNLNIEYSFRTFLEPLFKAQTMEACLGTINEVFDGDEPHTPRGCVSQAWSLAEPLRAYVEDILRVRPKYEKEVLGPSKTSTPESAL